MLNVAKFGNTAMAMAVERADSTASVGFVDVQIQEVSVRFRRKER
jgi:hypothetical protein